MHLLLIKFYILKIIYIFLIYIYKIIKYYLILCKIFIYLLNYIN